MKEISVIGHKNPDTDCTLSAIIMSDFLTKKGYMATPYIQGQLNKETEYLLGKYGIKKPEIKTVLNSEIETCLVDHNELSQAPNNLSELNITWLIDHHKIQFESANPLNIRLEPLCSTASILYKMYVAEGYAVSQEIATMMLACIMSDSLLWKSPTTTEQDKIIASKLQDITGISDLEIFAMPMFEAKSDLGDSNGRDILLSDYKIFEINGYKYGSGAVETTSPNPVLKRKSELLEAMKELKKKQNLDFIMLSVVDILGETNTSITLSGEDSDVIKKVFNVTVESNLSDLGARLSRKKQIIPDLTEYFNSI